MHVLSRDIGKFIDVLRTSDIRFTSRMVMYALRARLLRNSEKSWKSNWGVTTTNSAVLHKLDVTSENKQYGFAYAPSPARSVRAMLSNIPEQFDNFSFVDFGSGEGWALLVAASYPFKEVVGVEFARELHEVAERNIANADRAGATAGRVRAVHQDAAHFPVPHNESVLYFYNPFAEHVFAQVLGNIQSAHEACGKKMYVIFQHIDRSVEDNQTDNVSILRAASFLKERTVRIPSFWDRILLNSHESFIFETK